MSKSLDESDTTSDMASDRKGSWVKVRLIASGRPVGSELEDGRGRDEVWIEAGSVAVNVWDGRDFENNARWADFGESAFLARFDACCLSLSYKRSNMRKR